MFAIIGVWLLHMIYLDFYPSIKILSFKIPRGQVENMLNDAIMNDFNKHIMAISDYYESAILSLSLLTAVIIFWYVFFLHF